MQALLPHVVTSSISPSIVSFCRAARRNTEGKASKVHPNQVLWGPRCFAQRWTPQLREMQGKDSKPSSSWHGAYHNKHHLLFSCLRDTILTLQTPPNQKLWPTRRITRKKSVRASPPSFQNSLVSSPTLRCSLAVQITGNCCSWSRTTPP